MRVKWKKNPNDLSGKFDGLEEQIQESIGREWVRLGWCDEVRIRNSKPAVATGPAETSGPQSNAEITTEAEPDADAKGLEGPPADKAIRSPIESKRSKRRSG